MEHALHDEVMRTILCWSAAAVLILLCYATRFDTFAREYLASAYVLRNLAIELIAALFIVLGLPHGMAARIRVPLAAGWLAGMIALALWYAPPLLIAAVNSVPVRIVQAITWLAGGFLLLMPVY